MAKIITTAIFLFFLTFNLKAVVYTTVANGAWNAGATWSPSAPPCNLPAGSSIVINHFVTLTCNIILNGSMTINAGGRLTGNRTITVNSGTSISNSGLISTTTNINVNSGGSITNNGTMTTTADINVNSGGTYTNNGTVTALDFNNQGTTTNSVTGTLNTTDDLDNQNGTFTNNGNLNIADDLKNDPGNFTNNGVIVVTNDIDNQDGTFINNGGISVADDLDNQGGTWTENGNTSVTNTIDNTGGGTITGTAQLCASTIDNAGGVISGSIDICGCGGSGNPIIGGGSVGGSVTFCSPTLPVELKYFSGNVCEKNICLNWSTLTEINNDRFVLERSFDALVFEKIGEIKSKSVTGNSTSELSYDFMDYNPIGSYSYYRLHQFDFDGKGKYSPTISVFLESKRNVSFVVYPNPNKGEFTVDFSGIENNHEIAITIVDMVGKIIYETVVYQDDILSNSFKIIPNIALPSGKYLVRMKIESVSHTVKMLVE
ncbi:MAG: T9SS type A sorting domain-containing protein [Bacteroidota bacterium]|nr:T9SS type A sorting domain-containing protein [Bacteroidota bacterium]